MTIEVGNEWFCDPGDPFCTITDIEIGNDVDVATTINVGDTVTWNFVEGTGPDNAHTTTECSGVCGTPDPAPKPDPLWDSGQVDAPGTFSLTFGPEDAGQTFLYRCETHIFTMHGSVTVLAADEPVPTPTASPEGSPETSPLPSIAPTPDMPPFPGGGGAPPAQARTSIPWWLLIAGGGFLMASASLLALRLRR